MGFPRKSTGVGCHFFLQGIFLTQGSNLHLLHSHWIFPGGSDGKASAYNVGDPGSIPGLGRSPGEGNGNLLQYSCLENPMDGGAWWAAVQGVAQSRTGLSDTFHVTSPLNSGIKGHDSQASSFLPLRLLILFSACFKDLSFYFYHINNL